jgi:membrane-associated protease RseP (regulator of RpoE activity)
MNGVDLNRFDFDYDVTWNSFFLDEKLNVYSRYGGRDDGEPERRLSKDALLRTMRSVLAAHAERKARPTETVDLLQPIPKTKSTPEDIPLLKQNHQGCVHCHQVKEYQLLQWAHDGVFDRRKLFGWPLPENVGVELDWNHGTRVAKVKPDSPAERAGLKPGDVLARWNDIPVRSEYDIRWVLHRASDREPMTLQVHRGPEAKEADGMGAGGVEPRHNLRLELRPEGDWRPTDIGWRKSMRSVPLEFEFRGYALSKSQRAELKLAEDRMAIRVVSAKAAGLAGSLGLKKGDVITAAAGRTDNRTIEQLLSDLLRAYSPGDEVKMTVLREGVEVSLTGQFPAWHTDETTVP